MWSYDRLARLVRRAAAGLVAGGIRPHDVVAVVMGTGPPFVATLFGTMLAGATVAPLAPPSIVQKMPAYQTQLTALLAKAKARAVVCDKDLVATVKTCARALPSVAVMSWDAIAETSNEFGGDGPRCPEDIALLQFTSGSSGSARGVRVHFEALEANVGAIRKWLHWTREDPVASWLPVHHDMGLIGCLICPAVSRSDLWLMSPEEFVKSPLRYLECFGHNGARLTAMPNFGLDYVIAKVCHEDLEGMDFTHWRAVIVGAERLHAHSFTRFHDLLAPYGLKRESLLPAYGLAEATLAVSGAPLTGTWVAATVDPASLSPGSRVRLQTGSRRDHQLVGCGTALENVSVDIVDEGEVLPEGHVGEILVTGLSVASGYASTETSSTRFVGRALRTGDAGLLLGGELFVLGRLGDSLKIRGRAIFAEDIESALRRAGLAARQVVALAGSHRGSPTVVVVVEELDTDTIEKTRRALQPIAEGAELVVIDVQPGTIPRTSSGKPRRKDLWSRFDAGNLEGTIVLRSSGRSRRGRRQSRRTGAVTKAPPDPGN